MKKVVKEKKSALPNNKVQEFWEYLDTVVSDYRRGEIYDMFKRIFLDSDEEITPEELTDDMTLVKVSNNDVQISFADDAYIGYDYAYAVLSKKEVIRKGISCKSLADLVGNFNYTTYYAFTSHIEALEFALEQVKKQQHD